jgi:hypothetical protein
MTNGDAGEKETTEKGKYYEAIVSSYLRRDPIRRLRSSTNIPSPSFR